MFENWVNQTQAARLLDCAPSTLHNWRKSSSDGKTITVADVVIPFREFEGRWMYYRPAVETVCDKFHATPKDRETT